MNEKEIKNLAERIQEKALDLSLLLKLAEKSGMEATMTIERKASTTEDVVRNIQLKEVLINH